MYSCIHIQIYYVYVFLHLPHKINIYLNIIYSTFKIILIIGPFKMEIIKSFAFAYICDILNISLNKLLSEKGHPP